MRKRILNFRYFCLSQTLKQLTIPMHNGTATHIATPVSELLYKGTVARCYGYTPAAFWRIVHANDECLASLITQGYRRRARTLTPTQLRTLFKYFGYPLTPQEIEDND